MQELERRVEARPACTRRSAADRRRKAAASRSTSSPKRTAGCRSTSPTSCCRSPSVSPDYFRDDGHSDHRGRTFAPDDRRDALIVERRSWRAGSGARPRRSAGGSAFDTDRHLADRDRRRRRREADGAVGSDGRQGWSSISCIPRDTRNVSLAFMVRAHRRSRRGPADGRGRSSGNSIPSCRSSSASTMPRRIGESIARPRFYLALSSAFAVDGRTAGRDWRLWHLRLLGLSAPARARDSHRARRVGRESRGSWSWPQPEAGARRNRCAGLAVAIAGTRLIESMLFQTSGRDPMTLVRSHRVAWRPGRAWLPGARHSGQRASIR